MSPDYTLYVCTDRDLMTSATVEESVEKSIQGGAGVIQLREKDVSGRVFFDTAVKVAEVTKRYNIPLIINDRIDIALACKADGVHIGHSDLPVKVARDILGEDKILGFSVHTKEALKEAQGADYLGVGAVFATPSKQDSVVIGIQGLQEIVALANLPVVAIGGITTDVLPQLSGIALSGIAVVRAIMDSDEVIASTKALKNGFKSIVSNQAQYCDTTM